MRRSILSILLWTTLTSSQPQTNTPLPPPTTVSARTNQTSQTTPVASPTPLEAAPPTTPPPLNNPPITRTPHKHNPIIDITIQAPRSPLPTSATSLVTDTHGFSGTSHPPSKGSNSEAATTPQEQTEPSKRTTTGAGVVVATETEGTAAASSGDVQNGGAKGPRVGGDTAASACALVVALAALTWAFADLD